MLPDPFQAVVDWTHGRGGHHFILTRTPDLTQINLVISGNIPIAASRICTDILINRPDKNTKNNDFNFGISKHLTKMHLLHNNAYTNLILTYYKRYDSLSQLKAILFFPTFKQLPLK